MAAIKENGMVTRLINATRHSKKEEPEDDDDQQEAQHERLGEVVDRSIDRSPTAGKPLCQR